MCGPHPAAYQVRPSVAGLCLLLASNPSVHPQCICLGWQSSARVTGCLFYTFPTCNAGRLNKGVFPFHLSFSVSLTVCTGKYS